MVWAISKRLMPETFPETNELHGKGSNDEIEANRTPAMTFQEYHKEAETYKDHHVHILEEWIVLSNICSSCSFIHSIVIRSVVGEVRIVLYEQSEEKNDEHLYEDHDDLKNLRH